MIEKVFQQFLRYVEKEGLPIEAIAVGDEKRVLMEHHFVPDQARNIYSHTKSFLSIAVGIALEQGKLKLEDRLADYFPEKLPENAQPWLSEMQLKHLLTMSSGFGKAMLMNKDRRAGTGMPDYLRYMFSRPVLHKPGETFVYSTADSILAGRMVEKAVGMRLSAFLYQVLFQHLEIGYPIWENDPQGHPIGGGSMFLKLSDMMKLGQLCLAEGVWKGKRLVSADWIKEAVSKQIDTTAQTPQEKADIWRCGYGYQFWMSPYPGSYRADGAYGQITTVLPEEGLVVSFQCPESGDFEKVKKAVHERIFLPAAGNAENNFLCKGIGVGGSIRPDAADDRN